MPGFTGYAAVYHDLSVDLGGFVERVRPGCFDASLAVGADVRLLINHDSNYVLGRTASGTAVFTGDKRGLRVDCDELPDTSYARNLVVLMDRGDINQMSFGFVTRSDAWNETDPLSGLPIRELVQADVFDGSVVTFPAYPSTTAEVRSIARSRRAVVPEIQSFLLAPRSRSWDACRAEAAIRMKTGATRGPNAAYASCFLRHGEEDDFGSYELLYCDVIDGQIRAVPRAIFAAAGVLNGVRGGASMPQSDQDEIKKVIAGWYQRMSRQFKDASIVVPWAARERSHASARRISDERRLRLRELEARLADEAIDALIASSRDRHGYARPPGGRHR
jgi:uncharacterized protein